MSVRRGTICSRPTSAPISGAPFFINFKRVAGFIQHDSILEISVKETLEEMTVTLRHLSCRTKPGLHVPVLQLLSLLLYHPGLTQGSELHPLSRQNTCNAEEVPDIILRSVE